jgi:uncharacterized protein GlcG (DUF336 family)
MSSHAKPSLLDSYGSIGVAAARELAAAAISEATRQGWAMAVAVVDRAGDLVLFERIDDTQPGSIAIAQAKARAAARFKRATKVIEDAVSGGRTALLGIPDLVPLEGGIPLVLDGKVVGAIGVSGAASHQDGVCAQAGVDALAKAHAARGV